jgi:hypothetical protein
MQQRWRRRLLTATATAMANGNGNSNGRLQLHRQQGRNRRWRQRWRRQWQWRRPRQGRPLQRKGCLFMWQRCAALSRGNTLPPPPWTQRKGHSPALRHGGDTAKSVCSPSRGRVPDSSPWIVFWLFFLTTVQFTEQPSVCPPHYSGTQEPCQPIDALPPPLLQELRQPIDNLPPLLLNFFSR